MINIEGVYFSYKNKLNKSVVQVLENINVIFESSKFYTIIGPSGSGKTTFLALLGGLDELDCGKIFIDDIDIKTIGYSHLRKNIVSYVFQDYYLFPYMTSLENVLMVMDNKISSFKEKNQEAIELLHNLGITPDEMNRKVKRLSGGQQQRIAIARCLASGAKYVLADEPTGNLDNKTAEKIILLFVDLVEKYKKCVITATHSDMVRSYSDVSFRLNDKKLEHI